MFKRLIAVTISVFLCLIPACSPLYAEDYDIYFADVACIKPHKDYHYMTCAPIAVTIGDSFLIVPENFDTDLASIPHWLWSFIAPTRSDFMEASILHDYLYTCHSGFSRKDIDGIFYQSLVINGVPKLRAALMYLAVRLFGSSHFNKEGTCQERLAEKINAPGSGDADMEVFVS